MLVLLGILALLIWISILFYIFILSRKSKADEIDSSEDRIKYES